MIEVISMKEVSQDKFQKLVNAASKMLDKYNLPMEDLNGSYLFGGYVTAKLVSNHLVLRADPPVSKPIQKIIQVTLQKSIDRAISGDMEEGDVMPILQTMASKIGVKLDTQQVSDVVSSALDAVKL